MQRIGRLVALIVVLFVSVGCDRATKTLAQQHLAATEPLSFFDGIVQLRYAENPGAFLSLGAALPAAAQGWIFIGVVALLLVGLGIFALKQRNTVHPGILVAFALFLGGGLGNLIDRITNDGRVIDFMIVGVGPLRTGIFNVADMAIMAGVVLVAFFSLRKGADRTS
jgi:signal peptidase II